MPGAVTCFAQTEKEHRNSHGGEYANSQTAYQAFALSQQWSGLVRHHSRKTGYGVPVRLYMQYLSRKLEILDKYINSASWNRNTDKAKDYLRIIREKAMPRGQYNSKRKPNKPDNALILISNCAFYAVCPFSHICENGQTALDIKSVFSWITKEEHNAPVKILLYRR